MKQRHVSQDRKLSPKYLERRQTKRFLQRKFGKSKKYLPLLNRLLDRGIGKVNMMEEYDKMLAWCAVNRITKITILRYNNWIKNHFKWADERSQSDLEKYEREKTKKLLDSRDTPQSDN